MAKRLCLLLACAALLGACMPQKASMVGLSPAMQTMEGRSWTGADWPRTGLPPDRDAGKD
ncbi:MAG: hypothetical protein ACRDBH_10495 [Bosea sp. (in: a-proteobacteria)]